MGAIAEIRVGVSSCGLAAGAARVVEKIEARSDKTVVRVGCIGVCYAEPLVEVIDDQGKRMLFGNVTDNDEDIDQVLAMAPARMLTIPTERNDRQLLRVTGLIGSFEPTDMDAYIERGGFSGLTRALAMEPAAVVEEVRLSGLRGRGGGGFPTGVKWGFLAGHDESGKVLICNADEGDPGAFMDRSLMESLPYQMLEGMLIAAFATGAHKLFIYCRAEYPLAIKHLKIAISRIAERGLNKIGDKAVGITIKEGAGAFVCGEETALIHSLEGKRGMPRFRPPFPTDKGYFDAPTMINNVETFANVPLILRDGAAAYAAVGTAGSKGTKLFALAGDIPRPGLVEVPMGITLGEIIYNIGGAAKGSVKAVQIGGPSGGCIPASLFDTPVDYDSLTALGAIMGSGGLVVVGQERCMVETARYFLDFTHRESCGKCTFCRVGSKRMFETLERITRGEGEMADLDFLKEMGAQIKAGSLCGLGKTCPNPVLATLRYFKEEFMSHLENGLCPAHACNALTDVAIDKANCTECGRCIKVCAVGAVSDDYVVDNRLCTRCNSCIESCPQHTIARIDGGVGFRSSEVAR